MEKITLKVKKLLILFSTLFLLASTFLLPNVLFAQDETTTSTTKLEPSITFDIVYPELKAKSGSQFSFSADILFTGEDETTVKLTAEAPQGWYVSIQPAYEENEISAIKLKPDKKESLKFVAVPLTKQEPGEYVIKIKAEADNLKAEAELKAIITATYELTFTPTSGRYDTKVTAGKDNHFALQLKNTGSAAIEKITLTSSGPEGWRIKFNPSEIDKLEAGLTKDIDLIITPPEKTIAGDYMLTLDVNSENSNQKIDLRVTVQTPTIWGWVGIGIIVVVIIGIGVIFAKLGRR